MVRFVHDTAAILDAAARLLATQGPAGVTMSAVIRESGAPSGSVYHRFADRPSLLAALWNRAIEHLHRDAYVLLDQDDPVEAAAAIAGHIVRWCRSSPLDAQVLLAGAHHLAPQNWPAAAREERAAETGRWDAAVRALVHSLRDTTGLPTATILLTVVDLPYAAVRRYLTADRPIPTELDTQVPAMVRTLLNRLPATEDTAAVRQDSQGPPPMAAT
ncbi:TetR/AcrR family transcriptional regulator [Nocardia vaccinii]|uniref:TetR/AcrR family transcriptional regulator n=1 Tax=Nocardia vaccinii TaxID=1822 RepID=UPI000A015CEE|nr:TetR/AcrR family transcriptional regulator [Nocardia vaccinii]